LPDCGHFVMTEGADGFAALVNDFVSNRVMGTTT
jgi:pimeloyl-ACP methyl ester carboxylesterase